MDGWSPLSGLKPVVAPPSLRRRSNPDANTLATINSGIGAILDHSGEESKEQRPTPTLIQLTLSFSGRCFFPMAKTSTLRVVRMAHLGW